MRDATTVILAMLLGFLLSLLKQTKERRNIQDIPDGYEVIMCKKIDQRGDTIITINKLLPTHEETND